MGTFQTLFWANLFDCGDPTEAFFSANVSDRLVDTSGRHFLRIFLMVGTTLGDIVLGELFDWCGDIFLANCLDWLGLAGDIVLDELF